MRLLAQYNDCGCGGSNPALIPGLPGTPGSVWYHGAGAPGSLLGIVGDYYLNDTNGDYYTKTSGGWGSPIGNLFGSAGAAGTNGTSVIAQVYPGTSTSAHTATLLNTITVPLNTLKTNGSYLELETIFGFTDTNTGSAAQKRFGIKFNGNITSYILPNAAYIYFSNSWKSPTYARVITRVKRVSNTTVQFSYQMDLMNTNYQPTLGYISPTISPVITVPALDANALDFTSWGYSLGSNFTVVDIEDLLTLYLK